MLKKTKKFALNFKILRFFILPAFFVSVPLLTNINVAQAGLEFQWDQVPGFRRLKWFQTEDQRKLRNTIYFFFRPIDRGTDLLKISLVIPKTFKSTLIKEKISFCKVRVGGFENRTKCIEDIPADIEVNTEDSSKRKLNIYPYSPIPSNKDSYAIVLKLFNPKRSGLYQFHSYGQPKGQSVSTYLGSWTIVID